MRRACAGAFVARMAEDMSTANNGELDDDVKALDADDAVAQTPNVDAVVLISKEGQRFELQRSVAAMSDYIRSCIELGWSARSASSGVSLMS